MAEDTTTTQGLSTTSHPALSERTTTTTVHQITHQPPLSSPMLVVPSEALVSAADTRLSTAALSNNNHATQQDITSFVSHTIPYSSTTFTLPCTSSTTTTNCSLSHNTTTTTFTLPYNTNINSALTSNITNNSNLPYNTTIKSAPPCTTLTMSTDLFSPMEGQFSTLSHPHNKVTFDSLNLPSPLLSCVSFDDVTTFSNSLTYFRFLTLLFRMQLDVFRRMI